MDDEKSPRRNAPQKRTWSRADLKAAIKIYLQETPPADREAEREMLLDYLKTVKPW